MTIQEYLENRLKKSFEYEISEEKQKTIKFEGIKTYIFRELKSKKFRKTKLDESSEVKIKNAISLNVDKNEPIKITYPFGGYKSWRLETYPEVDWAEFMTIVYLIEYVSAIAAAYKPGVEVQFSSDDIVIELIDNYPREDLDKYYKSFRKLLKEFEKYLPDNLKVDLYRTAEMYTEEEYKAETEKLYEDWKKIGFEKENYEKQIKGFEFNFNWNGKEDLRKINKKEKKELIDDLMFWSVSYLQLSKRRAFVRGEDKIVVFSSTISDAINIGSTRVSQAKFWVGTGVLEIQNGKYYERVVSPKQLDDIKKDLKKEKIDLIPLGNFKEIFTYNGRLNFKK